MTKKKTKAPILSTPQGESPAIRDTVRLEFYESVAKILRTARNNAYRTVNFTMAEAYWNVGRRIVEEEQQGRERAEYGIFLIRNLSIRLKKEFGKGFTESSLWYCRQFYLAYPADPEQRILDALRRELSWTHYRLLLRVEKPEARAPHHLQVLRPQGKPPVFCHQIPALPPPGGGATEGAGMREGMVHPGAGCAVLDRGAQMIERKCYHKMEIFRFVTSLFPARYNNLWKICHYD